MDLFDIKIEETKLNKTDRHSHCKKKKIPNKNFISYVTQYDMWLYNLSMQGQLELKSAHQDRGQIRTSKH